MGSEPLHRDLQKSDFTRLVHHPSTAIVLVRPDQYLYTFACLHSCELKRYNVVIAESEEYLLDNVLARMVYKQRSRENRGERKELDLGNGFVEKRTFLCEVPMMLSSSAVVQST